MSLHHSDPQLLEPIDRHRDNEIPVWRAHQSTRRPEAPSRPELGDRLREGVECANGGNRH
jgi:hypothetical protein